MRLSHGALPLLVACSGASSDPPLNPDAPAVIDAPIEIVDNDGDGLDDAYETKLASDYLPFISLDPNDACKRSGLVVRVRKHPDDATKILIFYDHLFETDCG